MSTSLQSVFLLRLSSVWKRCVDGFFHVQTPCTTGVLTSRSKNQHVRYFKRQLHRQVFHTRVQHSNMHSIILQTLYNVEFGWNSPFTKLRLFKIVDMYNVEFDWNSPFTKLRHLKLVYNIGHTKLTNQSTL